MLRKSFIGLGVASMLCSPLALADARVSVARTGWHH